MTQPQPQPQQYIATTDFYVIAQLVNKDGSTRFSPGILIPQNTILTQTDLSKSTRGLRLNPIVSCVINGNKYTDITLSESNEDRPDRAYLDAPIWYKKFSTGGRINRRAIKKSLRNRRSRYSRRK
jgi:hypothetical protein